MRTTFQIPNQSTLILSVERAGITAVIQAPLTNTLPIEIAIDDVHTQLVAGAGLLLYPGDFRVLPSLPQNARGCAGILAMSTGEPPQTLILQA